DPRRDVPLGEPDFPESVVPATGRVGQVETRGTRPAQTCGRAHERFESAEIGAEARQLAEREAGRDQRLGSVGGRAAVDREPVQARAPTAAGVEGLIPIRVVDGPGDEPLPGLEGYRHREHRYAV